MSKIQFLNEPERSARLSRIPDARFEIEASGNCYHCALEAELSRKTRKRIFDRLEAHVINPDLDFIFFVVSDENHLKVLWDVYQDVLAKSFRVKLRPSQNGIYFVTLKNLRTLRLQVKFLGTQQNFCFASLRK
jgi:hypothetical protein